MIEKRLEDIHKLICGAGYLICYQIIKRKLSQYYLVEVVEKLKLAINFVEQLIADTKKKSHAGEPILKEEAGNGKRN